MKLQKEMQFMRFCALFDLKTMIECLSFVPKKWCLFVQNQIE